MRTVDENFRRGFRGFGGTENNQGAKLRLSWKA
jgi:hypothetical protein